MTESTTPPADLPPTLAECEQEQERLEENLDPVAIMTAISIVCDALDIDLMTTMMKIKLNHRLAEGTESIIGDLIECSASNYPATVDALYRFAILNEHIDELDLRDSPQLS